MLKFDNLSALAADVGIVHNWLSPHFARDTANPGTPWGVPGTDPSLGHCAVAAIIIQELFGGELVSLYIDGESHWFNRIDVRGFAVDVDVTGGQFDRPAVQIGPADALYDSPARVRGEDDMSQETVERAALLAGRAHITLLSP